MSKFVKFARELAQDEGGVVAMEWVVAASILAGAGIAAFLAIGGEVSGVLNVLQHKIRARGGVLG